MMIDRVLMMVLDKDGRKVEQGQPEEHSRDYITGCQRRRMHLVSDEHGKGMSYTGKHKAL